jgi:hypothetical protein
MPISDTQMQVCGMETEPLGAGASSVEPCIKVLHRFVDYHGARRVKSLTQERLRWLPNFS